MKLQKLRNPGLIVLTKSGKKGRTYHHKEDINGKTPVYLETLYCSYEKSGILCDPNTLQIIGYIDWDMKKIAKKLERQLELLRELIQMREDKVDERSEKWQESEKWEEWMDKTQEIEEQADELEEIISNLHDLTWKTKQAKR